MPTSGAFKHQNLPDQLADHVVAMIANGELQPGERLFEKSVSDLLSVSRIPVREAMRILQANGVIQSEPNRGSFISETSLSETSELLDVRVTIERLALRRLLQNDKARSIAVRSLSNSLQDLQRAAMLGDVFSYCKADLAFHSQLVSASDSQTLCPLWESLSRRVLIFLVQERTVGFNYDVSMQDHKRLIDLLISNDDEALHDEICQHIKGYFPALINRRTQN